MSLRSISRLALVCLLVTVASSLAHAVASAARDRFAPPPTRILEPRNLSPRALAIWRWRQEQDRPLWAQARIASPAAALVDGSTTLLNDTTGILGNDQNQLAVATRPGHNIVLAWRDNRGGDGDIRVQLFTPAGVPLTPPGAEESAFVVNDDGQSFEQSEPAIAMNSNGEFVVAFVDLRQGTSDIWMQRYHADGTPDSSNIKLDIGGDQKTSYGHGHPTIDLDDLGNIVAAWTDDRQSTPTETPNGVNSDIFAVRFNPNNTPHFLPFTVSLSFRYAGARVVPGQNLYPSVVFTHMTQQDSGFVVVWQSKDVSSRGGRRMTLARRFSGFDSRRGSPLDTLTLPIDSLSFSGADAFGASSPVVLAAADDDSDHAITVAWVDSTSGAAQIAARKLYPVGWTDKSPPFRAPVTVISDAPGSDLQRPALARLSDGTLAAIWSMTEGGVVSRSVHARLLDANLNPLGASSQVNTSVTPYSRVFPGVGAFGSGSEPHAFFAAWIERQPAHDAAIVRPVGSGASSDSTLIRDREPDQINPSIAYNLNGQGVAVWTDFRNGRLNPDIYAQRVDAQGAAVGGNIRVNSDSAGAYQDHARAGIDATGAFTAVWEDTRRGNFQVFARRFAPDGTAAGGDFPVALTDTSEQFRPAISTTPASGSAIVWEDNVRGFRTSPLKLFDIYLRPLSPAGALVGNAVRISPLSGDTSDVSDLTSPNLQDKLNPSVATDPQGNGLVSWDVNVLSKVGATTQILTNRDIDARYFLAPSTLVPMTDTQGQSIESDALSLADSVGAIFPQQHGQLAYVGNGQYAAAFEDERLGTTSREDIRARLLGVQATADTARIYTPAQTFAVNDDIHATAPDLITGEVQYLSASQFAPAIGSDPVAGDFTIAWTDRRGVGSPTGTSYNIFRQSYRVIAGATPADAAHLRFLGRNTAVNEDSAQSILLHGAAGVAYAGTDRIAVGFQSNQRGGTQDDVFLRVVDEAPDTCANDTCLNAAPSVHFAADLSGDHDVTLRWEVPASQAVGSFQVVRLDAAQYAANPLAGPQAVLTFGPSQSVGEAQDVLSGAPSNYVYQLWRGAQILATAAPARPQLSYAMRLSGAVPNPARSLTRIQFTVPGRSGASVAVRLAIYDVSGRRLRSLADGLLPAGQASRVWRGDTEAGTLAGSGVYFLKMQAGNETQTRKLLWLR